MKLSKNGIISGLVGADWENKTKLELQFEKKKICN